MAGCVKGAECFIIKWYNFLLSESVSSILNEEEENFKLNVCARLCLCAVAWWVGREFKGNFWNILWDLIKMLLTLGRTSVAVCLCSARGWRLSSCYVSWFESPRHCLWLYIRAERTAWIRCAEVIIDANRRRSVLKRHSGSLYGWNVKKTSQKLRFRLWHATHKMYIRL